MKGTFVPWVLLAQLENRKMLSENEKWVTKGEMSSAMLYIELIFNLNVYPIYLM